ncbi:MAG: N-acetyltransferase family protein [Candidatus Dormibacteria bacterium]
MSERPALLRRHGVTEDGRTYLVRPTTSDDAAALVSVHDEVAAEGGLIASAPGERSILEEHLTLAALVTQGGVALTLVVEGEVSGQLLVNRRRDDEASVGDIAIVVHKSSRGVGLGRVLMETAIDWAHAVGLHKLGLSVFGDNGTAIGLYRSMGFVEEGSVRQRAGGSESRRQVLVMGLRL